MVLKDILVHVDESANCAVRIKAAVALAELHNAALTGLYVIPHPDIPAYVDFEIPEDILAEREAELVNQAGIAEKAFAAASGALGSAASWRCETGHPLSILLHRSRYTDLIMVGSKDMEGAEVVFACYAEKLALESGTAVLVLPREIGEFDVSFKNILLGWNESRESTRALHDALPLLQRSDKVTAVSIRRRHEALAGDAADALTQYLLHHGIACDRKLVDNPSGSTGEALLELAEICAADLIVSGAYGHTRFRELVLGGVTRHLLTHAPIPVLIAH
jgi:nucleotide-binding universal stress UspA family protein